MKSLWWRSGLVTACAVACGLFASGINAGENLVYAPVASWVTPEAPPMPDPVWAGAPAQVLLQNTQVHFEVDGAISYYAEFAIKIQTAAGLQAAQSWITWNPATDDVTVHKAQILRGKQIIDVLAKGQTFTTMRREQNLDRAMLDGYLTGILHPEGLEVGDTFVFSSTIRRRDPLFEGKAASMLAGLSSGPTARQVIRATWDKERQIRFRQSDDLKGKVTKAGGIEAYGLIREKVTANETRNDVPSRFNERGLVEFTEFSDWAELSRLMAPLYATATTVAADSPLHKEIAAIRSASNDPKVQAAAALKLVQNQVRYLYLGMNLGGYDPAGADITWQRRFGDCKGKTALLVALLRELGIKADPALVNSGGGDGLNQRLPSIEVFDHVIVRAEIEGRVYWLDGTRLGDRDLDSITPPYTRWALPVTLTGAALEAVPMLPPEKPTEDLYFVLDASAGLDVPAKARLEKVLRGDEAVQFNDGFQSIATNERENALKAWWKESYNWIEPKKVSAIFDASTGEERLTMEGLATMEWKKSDDGKAWRYQTDILSLGWSEGIERADGPNKYAPVLIAFPFFVRTRQEIILPKKGKDFTVDGAGVDKTLGGAEFKRQVSLKDGVLTLEASRRSLVPELAYKDAKAAAPTLLDLWKNDIYLVAPLAYRKETNASTSSEASTGSEEVRKLVTEAGQSFSRGNIDEALPKLNKALSSEPENVVALILRGGVFMARNNPVAARADFDLALKLDPTQWGAWNGMAAVSVTQNRLSDALEAYTKAIEIYPNNLFALQGRARLFARLKEFDKARADLDSASDLDPDSTQVLDLRVSLELSEDKRASAEQILRDAIETRPNDAPRRLMLANFLNNCSRLSKEACQSSRQLARSEFDKLIAEGPTVYLYSLRAWTWPEDEREKALADLDQAIKLEEAAAWPILSKVRFLMKGKRYDEVPALLEKAATLEPKNWEIRSARSEFYLETSQKTEALKEVAALKRENPRDANVLNSVCWSLATHNVELEAALVDCEAGLKLVPVSYMTLDSRAFVKLRLKRFDEAIADYDLSLDISPDRSVSLFGRGLAKLAKGDQAGGEADLKAARALSYDIDDVFAGYGLRP
ncbi:tetratricopeptide repeat protein [Asticcacaulis sp.]|uniref:tetratricopeptide repeat protein n=1 Tax=Asticcacaulis sp. TaxID=1872648 RepID=UPI0031E1729D